MATVYIGGITPEAEHILNKYLGKHLPDAKVEVLKPIGIKGKLKNYATKPDVILVVIDESLYATCIKDIPDVLKMPKLHKYTNDDNLEKFLRYWFAEDSSNIGVPSPAVGKVETKVEFVEKIVTQPVDTSEYDRKISDLQNKLAQSDLLVQSLTQQLADSNANNDVSDFIKRIKDLESTISDREFEIQKLRYDSQISNTQLEKVTALEQEIEKLREELRISREDCSRFDFERDKLISDKKSIESALNKANEELSDLRELPEKYEEVTRKLEEMKARYNDLLSQSEADSSIREQLELAQDTIKELESVREELKVSKSTIREKEAEIYNITVDLESKSKRCNELLAAIDNFRTQLEEKENDLGAKELELAQLASERENSSTAIGKLEDTISGLKQKVTELTVVLEEKTNRITELEQQKSDSEWQMREQLGSIEEHTAEELRQKDSEIGKLKETIKGYTSQISLLTESIEELEDSIAAKDGELSGYRTKEGLLQTKITKVNSDIDKLTDDITSLNEQLDIVTSERDKLAGEIESIRDSSNQEKSSYLETIEDLQTQLYEAEENSKKYKAEIFEVKTALVEAQLDSENLASTEAALNAERRKVARLTSELEVLKSSADLMSSSDSSVELAQLREEVKVLREQKSLVTDSAEVSGLREEIEMLKADVVCKDELIEEFESNIFTKLGNVALPKIAYDIKLSVPEHLTSKFVCMAASCSESNITLYKTMVRSCVNSGKRVLILDLTTDTCIDSAFGVSKIDSPTSWLTGADSFKSFVASSKYPNIKVMSIALAYFNELALLNVDWTSRLMDLDGSADLIVINVGCLSNFVSRILYTSFTSVMDGHIIVKAAPLNLRTTILTLAGLKSLQNTIVSCFDFDVKSSKILYQKLVSRCQSQILKDTDTISL